MIQEIEFEITDPSGMKKPVIKIQNYVRKHTNAVDISTLHDRGFKKVNLITLSKINQLISHAVVKAFERYQNQLTDQERRRLRAEIEAELRQRIAEEQRGVAAPPLEGVEAGNGDEPPATASAARPEPEMIAPPPRSGLAESPPLSFPTPPPSGPAAPAGERLSGSQAGALLETAPLAGLSRGVIEELELRFHSLIFTTVREEIARRGGSPGEVDAPEILAFQDRLREAVSDVLHEESRRVSGLMKASPSEREAILERRLEKLKKELLEMEVTLEKLAADKGGDEGLASIYREVQGLNRLDSQYEKKKGLLQGVFEANLKLQSNGR